MTRYAIETSYDQGNAQALRIVQDISFALVDKEEDIQFDFSNYNENNPFSNLLIANTLRGFRKNHAGKCSLIPNKRTYLSHLGFYQMIGADYGKELGEATPSDNYVPITRVVFDGDFYGTIENKSRDLAALLKFDRQLSKVLEYLFTETIRNVYEHADAKDVYLTAQKWPSKNLLEIAISDAGCGVYSSLRKYRPYSEESEETLIKMACEPGISARSNFSYFIRGDAWRNSGYGLYLLRKLAVAYGGSFLICSGNYALREDDKGTKMYTTYYHGTTVAMRIRTDTHNNFDEVRNRIVREGELESRNNRNAIHIASMSSGGNYR